MEGIFSMEKWRSIAAGMSCLSMLFATGAVTVSASDEITEIPEQSIVYWSMWEEDYTRTPGRTFFSIAGAGGK